MKLLASRVLVSMAVASPFSVVIPAAFAAQVVAPPEAQAWIDVATFSGMGGMGGMSAMGGNPMSALGAMFGGKAGTPGTTGGTGNTFGNTRTMGTGRWVDVTVRARANPGVSGGHFP